MKKTTLEEKSAGGVVYQRKGDETFFLLGKHSGYHKWVLPKGLIEPGESETETAVREVEEEVGVKARIVDMAPLRTIEYWFYADPSASSGQVWGKDAKGDVTERRVKRYQEDGGNKIRVHKKVVFYLMELVEDSGKSGWEMEERKWVRYEEAKGMLAFETEREVLEKAFELVGASGQN